MKRNNVPTSPCPYVHLPLLYILSLLSLLHKPIFFFHIRHGQMSSVIPLTCLLHYSLLHCTLLFLSPRILSSLTSLEFFICIIYVLQRLLKTVHLSFWLCYISRLISIIPGTKNKSSLFCFEISLLYVTEGEFLSHASTCSCFWTSTAVYRWDWRTFTGCSRAINFKLIWGTTLQY